MKVFLDEAGNTHEAVYLDGYDIADRLLEGVMIKIQVADDGTVSASFLEGDREYVSSLNETKLLKEAASYAKSMIDEDDMGSLSPTPRSDQPYDMIVELVASPPTAVRPSPC